MTLTGLVSFFQTSQPSLLYLQVLQKLSDFSARCPATRILLAPSTRDAYALPVFPQPPMCPPSSSAAGAAGITWLSNPSTFRLNEVTVGLVTADVLKHLASQEAQRGPAPDRMAALAGHLVAQSRSELISVSQRLYFEPY